jgi:SAM-dependent methyltransferase
MNAAEYEAMYRVEDTLWWYTGMRRVSEALLSGILRPGMRILDAGCGTGGNLQWLRRFGQVWGIDLSSEAMRFCRERDLDTVSRASVLDLPFPHGAFDLVTSFDVIYHLDVADDVAALREVRRVLRPGGVALVRVPALEQLRSEHDAAVHTRQRYSLDELRAKLSSAGFVIERACYANTLLFPLAAASRLIARRNGHLAMARGDEHRSDVHPVSPVVNAVFGAAMRLEAALVGQVKFPVGLSAFAVARRPYLVEVA